MGVLLGRGRDHRQGEGERYPGTNGHHPFLRVSPELPFGHKLIALASLGCTPHFYPHFSSTHLDAWRKTH